MTKNVLVFGCGPAGLMVAHAAALADCNVKIVSKKRKSHLHGAQYLHAPIPYATTEAPIRVVYELRGTAQQYREKVYGKGWRGTVSPEDLDSDHDAWDIRSTYDWLWEAYGEYVTHMEVSSPGVWAAVADKLAPDFCFSTVPAISLCHNEDHVFGAKEIWAIGDAPALGQRCPVPAPRSTVVCNGEKEPAWYRAANVWGYTTAEWAKQPPFDNAVKVLKPLKTDCICQPTVLRAGRYGKWEKGVLTSDAFEETVKVLA